MTNTLAQTSWSWRASRYGFATFHVVALIAAWSVLRLALYIAFGPATEADIIMMTFVSGLQRDLLAGLALTLPLLIWMLVMPQGWRNARWYNPLFWTFYCIFWFFWLFILFVEFFFFEEFKSRFNTVAVDYVWYPREVFINIWESYHVAVIVGACVGLSLIWTLITWLLYRRTWDRPFSIGIRLLHVVAATALIAALVPTLDLRGAHVSRDRTFNEIANNGAISFAVAAWTHNLDFAAFYKTIDRAEAYQRARRLLKEPKTEFIAEGQSIRRRVSGDSGRPRLNVAIFLEESLGSEFWGCLGRAETLTPEMDKLAGAGGMLFTNVYASGNRTVRGFEGVLSSFPPLPGDSIVKRDLSDNVETVARVLKRDDYATVFLYGGRGLFDGMRSYALHNGYDRFIEQKHFPQPAFKTIWGVCDEDLFARALEEMRALSKGDKPFLATILSVSNHKPFTYPKGRIPENPDMKKREHAVKYSDYALGQFFRAAKQEPFWTNTIFVVVADHGARVYGQQSIPIHSYEIPLVILGPAVVKAPERIGHLGCSLDVSPTILGLIGRPYETMFFGRDLLNGNEGRVLLNHNRDIGMLSHERMVVLGLTKTSEFYQGDPKKGEMTLMSKPQDLELELEKDTIALYQVADDLYMHQRYRIDGEPAKGLSERKDNASKSISLVGGFTQ